VSLGIAAAIGVVRKLRRLCFVRVAPDDVAFVFNVHRRSVFSSSMEDTLSAALSPSRQAKGRLGRLGACGINLLRLGASQGLWRLIFPASRTYVVRPPLPMFSVFTLPRAVLDSSSGVAVDCVVEDVPVSDGTLRITLTLIFYIEAHEMNRYLTLLGPVAPHEALGRAVSQCLRQLARRTSSGVLLAKQRRTTMFLPDLTTQLRAMLCAECCVRMKNVVIEAVQLMDAPALPS
jgi:hypothetical protein